MNTIIILKCVKNEKPFNFISFLNITTGAAANVSFFYLFFSVWNVENKPEEN